MANYADTALLDALAYFTDPANAKEFRTPEYGAMQAYLDYANIMLPDLASIKEGESQAERIRYFKRSQGTVGTSRTVSLTGKYGDTSYLTPTWYTRTREFSISVKQAENNQESAARIMAHQLKNTIIDLYDAIETLAIAQLDANKTTSEGNRSGLGSWDSSKYVMAIANSDKDNYFNYIKTDMVNDKWHGLLQAINTGNINAVIAEQTAQGPGNSSNLQFQYPGFEFYTCTDASGSDYMASDYFGLSYIVEQGSIALVPWIPQANRVGTVAGSYSWSSIPDPFGKLGQLAVFKYSTASDTSSSGGTAQDAVYIYEVSVDVSFLHVPLSTGNVVYKYGLSTS